MADWSEIDCVIVRRKMGEHDRVNALEARVVEEGEPRDQSLEMGVAQVIDFIAEGGVFYTARESLGELELGGRLEVLEEEGGEQLRLRTVDGTDEKFYLESLPSYRDEGESPQPQ